MIDSKNMDPSASCIEHPILLKKDSIGASQTDIEFCSILMPFAGVVLSVNAYAVAITDADDSARVDVKKGSTSILSATINPTQATNVAGTLKTDGTATFASGDKLGLFVTTAGSDAITDLCVTVNVRPLAGSEASRPNL
jgi:hypothetical protein